MTSSSSHDQKPVESFAKRIVARVSLLEHVSQFVSLKEAGKGHAEMKGLCPFHEDKDPSLYVNPAKGVFECKGCGAAGDVIIFHEKFMNLSRSEAMRALAKDYGIYSEAKRDVDLGEVVLRQATNSYKESLQKNAPAMEYLISRGLSKEAIEKFNLGFCNGREINYKRPEYKEAALKAGVLVEDNRDPNAVKTKDPMARRIIFPITDRNGRVHGFGGRTLPGNDYGPKYKNTADTQYFNKSDMLYGIGEAITSIIKQSHAIVVEGYMDVVGLHDKDVTNSVGLMGASANPAAFEALWKTCNRITFCLDGDPAGLNGALRAILAAAPTMPQGKMIDVAILPNGVDPDEYILSHGKNGFDALIANAMPLSKFLTNVVADKYDLSIAENRGSFRAEINKTAETFLAFKELGEELRYEADAICMAVVVECSLGKKKIDASLEEISSMMSMLKRAQHAFK